MNAEQYDKIDSIIKRSLQQLHIKHGQGAYFDLYQDAWAVAMKRLNSKSFDYDRLGALGLLKKDIMREIASQLSKTNNVLSVPKNLPQKIAQGCDLPENVFLLDPADLSALANNNDQLSAETVLDIERWFNKLSDEEKERFLDRDKDFWGEDCAKELLDVLEDR